MRFKSVALFGAASSCLLVNMSAGEASAQAIVVNDDDTVLNQTADASNPTDSVILVFGEDSTINLIGANLDGGPFVPFDGPDDLDGLDFSGINFFARRGTVSVDANSSVSTDSFGISNLLSAIDPFGVDTTDIPIDTDEFLTVTNAGTITSTQEDGVRAATGLTLVNSGSIEGGSTLDGEVIQGIFTSAGDGVSAFHIPTFAAGVPDDVPLSSVTNTATGTIHGARIGVILSGGGEILNDGSIIGEVGGAIVQTAEYSFFDSVLNDIVVFAPRTRALITNNGIIEGVFDDGARLSSYSNDLTRQSFDLSDVDTEAEALALFDLPALSVASDAAFSDFDAVLVNTGRIETAAPADGDAVGAVFDPVSGEQLPVFSVSTFNAVSMGSGAGYIYNAPTGIIRSQNGAAALGLFAVDVINEASGTIRVNNEGTIDGNISGSDGQEFILNLGTISGSIGLGLGDDLVILSAGSTLSEDLTLGEGNDVLIADTTGSIGGFADGGDGDDFLGLILGGSALSTDQLFGFERVETFGTGDITGLDLSQVGELNLGDGGSLDVGSTGFTGGLFVNQGGTVVGTGELEFLVVNGGGAVSPGNSIGQFTVTGDVSLSAGSTYDVEVNGTASDQILASGVATIAGGSVLVSGEDGVDLQAGLGTQQYTILSADGGVTGAFESISDSLQFYHASLASTATSTFVVLDPVGADFLAVAQTSTQQSLGGVLQGELLDAEGDFLDLMRNSFPGLTDAQVRSGLDNLSGSFNAGTPIVTSQLAIATSTAARRDAELEPGQSTVWVEGIYEDFEFDDAEDLTSQAIVSGVELGLSRGLVVGGFLGITQGEVEDALGSATEQDGVIFGASARTSLKGLNISGSLGYLDQDGDTRRQISVGSVNRTAISEADSEGVFASIEASFLKPLSDRLSVGPVASLVGTRTKTDAFAETGAGSVSVSQGDLDLVRNVVRAGVHAEGEIGLFDLSLRGGWQGDLRDQSVQYDATLAGVSSGFAGESTGLSEDAGFVDLMADTSLNDRASLSFGYQGVFGDRHSSNGAYARLALKF
ncbi:MAG: autotransporter domain-containing protein [Pseudomonadota bacterium]